jgi:hypothetical protein
VYVWAPFVIGETWYERGCLCCGHASFFVGLEPGMDSQKKGGQMLYEMWRIKKTGWECCAAPSSPVRQHLVRVRCGLLNVPRWGKGGSLLLERLERWMQTRLRTCKTVEVRQCGFFLFILDGYEAM